MNYNITKNEQFNSLEITFDGKPSESVRESLKDLKFRWHGIKKCWYGYASEEEARAAINGIPVSANSKKSESKNDVKRTHSIKIGDVFYASWGYEQTNIDFFQVVELVGASSVRVREVCMKLNNEEAVSGMSCNRSYCLPNTGEMLPAVDGFSFIEDNDRGDLKRVKHSNYGGYDYFTVGKKGDYQTTVSPYDGRALYESWYA